MDKDPQLEISYPENTQTNCNLISSPQTRRPTGHKGLYLTVSIAKRLDWVYDNDDKYNSFF